MFKKFFAAALALFAAAAFAAVDVNKATQAELESVKGIGPSISTKIIDERKKGAFKDWTDVVERVKGVGDGNAAKFSAEGLTVNGATFANAPAAKTDAKPMGKADEKKAADKKAADKAAPATKADAKPAAMSADDKKIAKTADKAAPAKSPADAAKPMAAAAPAASAVVKK